MFNSISWGEYFSLVALGLVFYYIIVAFKFYRWEILSIMGIKKVPNEYVEIAVTEFSNGGGRDEEIKDKETERSSSIQSFKDEVFSYMEQACKNRVQKNELLISLQTIASRYPALKAIHLKDNAIDCVLRAAESAYPGMIEPEDAAVIII